MRDRWSLEQGAYLLPAITGGKCARQRISRVELTWIRFPPLVRRCASGRAGIARITGRGVVSGLAMCTRPSDVGDHQRLRRRREPHRDLEAELAGCCRKRHGNP